MKNNKLIENICALLGVSVGETWSDTRGDLYTINKDGSITVSSKDGSATKEGYIYWEDIFTGLVFPVR